MFWGCVGCLGFGAFLEACLLPAIKQAKKKRHQNAHVLINKVKDSCGTLVGHCLDITFLQWFSIP